MGIGGSIFLIAVGAILTFATDVQVSGLDLDVVGIILMIAGVLGLLMVLFVFGPRSRTTNVVAEPQAPTTRRTIVEE